MKFACITVVKNAERSIAEWIAFHLAIGADAIFLLDNGSTDRTGEIIRQYAERFDIRHADWPMATPDYQVEGFTRAIYEARDEFDWCACIDVDEFIMLPPDRSLAEATDVSGDISAIAMNWAMFGSSGHITRPEGLIIENYLHRADLSFPHNRMLKSMARPKDVQGIWSSHILNVTGAYVDMAHRPLAKIDDHIDELPDYSAGRLNHYFTQSRQDWTDKVVARGYHDTERSLGDFANYDRNDIFDDSALALVPEVREIMRQASVPPVRLRRT